MTTAVTRQVGGELWHVDAEYAPLLFPEDGQGLAAALAAGRVERVKGGHERQTGRITVGGNVFYVKEFHGPLGGRRARREWRTARRAFAAGLSTPRPVAAVWQGGAVCVTLDAGPGRTLSDLVYESYFEPVEPEPPYPGHRPPELVRLFRERREPPPHGAACRAGPPDPRADAETTSNVSAAPPAPPADVPSPRVIAQLIADLVIELHSLGLRYRDLHPGNLMVVGQDSAWRLVVLDLVALEELPRRASPEFGRRVVLEHLVQLNHFFEPLATRTERHRVLRLLESRGLRVAAEAGRIEVATWAYRYGFYRGRDRRSMRAGKYFDAIGVANVRGMAAADVAADLPETLSGLSRAVQIHEAVKKSRRETSGFGRLGERRVFVKRDTPRGWRGSGRPWPAALEHLLRGSRQERAWRRANALLVRGIRTARPLVWLDVLHGPLGRESLVVSEALCDPWRPLDEAVAATRGAAHTSLVAAVAREVRRMHDAGISNRDLKAQNILVQCVAGRWQVAVVDMVGVRVHREQVSRARRMQNLMRLAFSWSGVGVSGQARGASRADRLRFLKTYLGPYVRQTITVSARRRGSREVLEGLRTWWRGIAFALYEKAERSRR